MKRFRSWSGLPAFVVGAVVFLILSAVQLDPRGSSGRSTADEVDASEAPADGALIDTENLGEAASDGPSTAEPGKTADASSEGPTAKAGLKCEAGKNGGKTATGVTGSRIRLATTAVLDGPAKSLLQPSVTGMKAVVDKVNREGGVCGRILELNVVNDSFDANRGQNILKNFVAEGYFALPVVPSAEGLGSAIKAGDIRKAGIPVVGSDGLREEQYTDPWVWPVAAATVTSMRVMAKYGAEAKGAKTFAIVWDSQYKFGKEGHDAFKQQVEAAGGKLVVDQPLNPQQTSYASEADQYNTEVRDKCGGKCDMVAMLLLPDTAKAWMARRPALGKYTAGAQTLFTDRFAQDCVQAAAELCDSFAVWTGYNPPIGEAAAQPDVAQYVNDVRALDPRIDVNNQFLEGSYLGMSVFVEALRKVGPDLTRKRLAAVLDAMDFHTGLTSTLSWRPGNHYANIRAQSYAMSVSQGSFNGWRNERTGFLRDPAHGG